MKSKVLKFQIGKNGLTDGVIESLALSLKDHKQVRVSLLKSAEKERLKVKETASEIISKLPFKTRCRVIGFTIVLTKT